MHDTVVVYHSQKISGNSGGNLHRVKNVFRSIAILRAKIRNMAVNSQELVRPLKTC